MWLLPVFMATVHAVSVRCQLFLLCTMCPWVIVCTKSSPFVTEMLKIRRVPEINSVDLLAGNLMIASSNGNWILTAPFKSLNKDTFWDDSVDCLIIKCWFVIACAIFLFLLHMFPCTSDRHTVSFNWVSVIRVWDGFLHVHSILPWLFPFFDTFLPHIFTWSLPTHTHTHTSGLSLIRVC